MLLRAIILGLLLIAGSSSAYSQCSGNPAAGRFCGNPTAGATLPSWATGTAMLDRAFGSASGSVLNRNGSTWTDTQTPVFGVNGGTGGSLTLNGATSGSAVIGVKAAAGTTVFNLPVGNGALNNVLITDGSGNTSWAAAGGGTVSSVGLSLPGIFTVTNSPVTTTGTLTGTLNTQNANLIWAGPTTGAAATPTFRALVGADLPNPSASTLGGIQSFAGTTSQWIRSISTSGVPASSQPAFSDISGSITPAQCPNPSASTIGCIQSYVAVAHQWINTISTAGVPSSTQPNFTDLVGSATLAQLPTIGNNSILGNNSGGSAVPSALTTSNILDMINNVQGDVLYRAAGGTGWVALAPGTSGQVLTTGGAAANPAWATVTGTGTVTNVATGTGLTGGAITTTGTISLAPITSLDVLANITGGSATPIPNTMTAILDATLGSTQGNILYRGASVWQVLAPGTNGQVLTQGASTPSWANAGTLTNVTIAAGTGITLTGTCNISTSGTCTVAQTKTTLIELTGFSYYLGCNNVISCWVAITAGTFTNILNTGSNTKPAVLLDQLSEFNTTTGGFTPSVTGIYETRFLMEGTSTTAQSLMSCGWATTSGVQPVNAIVMIETQGASQFNNSHMTPFIISLTAGTTYFMNCWPNNNFFFNNLTVQSGAISPAPIVDFIIRRVS